MKFPHLHIPFITNSQPTAAKSGTPVEIIENVTPEAAESATANLRTQWAEENAGGDKFGTVVLSALDKAVGIQSGAIVKYVEGVKKRRPQATLTERQKDIDNHFLTVVTGTGAAAGGASAIPGVGFVTGTAAVAGESVLFLEAAAWYILASASLRGVDITDRELRRALVMLILSGARGVAVVDTFFADAAASNLASGLGSLSSVTALTRFTAPSLSGVNKKLAKTFLKQATKRFKWAWVGKLMPLGIGAVLGGVANRQLANSVMENTHAQLNRL